MDNSVNNLTEKDVFTLKKITYIYIKENDNIEAFEKFEYDEIMNVGKKWTQQNLLQNRDLEFAYNQLEQEYKKNSADLTEILRIFDISIFSKELKNSAGEYEFDESDMEFVCGLIKRYRTDKVWKEFKNVDNRHCDGFVKIYRKIGTSKILDELNYVFNGFSTMYMRINESKKRNIADFKNILLRKTQLKQITWMEEMKNVLFTIPTVEYEEAVYSVEGELLSEYQNFLNGLREKISAIINEGTKEWEKIVERKHALFNKRTQNITEKQQMAMQHFCSRIRECDDEDFIKAFFSCMDGEEPYNPYDPGTKEARRFDDHVRNKLKDVISELPPEDIIALGSMFTNTDVLSCMFGESMGLKK